MLEQLSAQLRQSAPLTDAAVAAAVAQLVDERVPAETKAGFLSALAQKGETTEEIAAFARELRAKSIQPPLDAETRAREILDVCGTGGDRLNTFNISTTVALVASAAGITVAKHGNRAITSQAGSADVLEALGLRIELSPKEAAAWLRDHRFAFFFAPNYHPAFKHIGPARKLCAERGQHTLFNFLGPLLNPARPSAQLVGVPRPQLCETMARVLQSLGLRRGMVVCGQVQTPAGRAHLDELSTLGENTVAQFYQDNEFNCSTLRPENFPIQPATLSDLAGGDRAANAEIVRRILRGDERGPKRDAVLLNAGAALFVAGHCRTLLDGWQQAGEVIDSGKAQGKLEELVEASGRR
ncbi:MAG TPA: anthranilate phosphoribosyltransferase [Verrucomicrobiae bacterium]